MISAHNGEKMALKEDSSTLKATADSLLFECLGSVHKEPLSPDGKLLLITTQGYLYNTCIRVNFEM